MGKPSSGKRRFEASKGSILKRSYLADLHVHSRFSRATSKSLTLVSLAHGALEKGIQLLGTGDFTHPGWLEELQQQLEPAEDGLFRLRPSWERKARENLPKACAANEVRFILQVEISSIYKKSGRVRKNHNLVFFPSFESVKRFNERLSKVGKLDSDGRPILRLDARDLLETTLQADPLGFLIPAHIWTPWYSMLGSKSGFDSIEECFEDLTSHVFAIETGLSSDPPMNWRVGGLDGLTLVSNSDAHSSGKIGREANVFEGDFGYLPLLEALRTRDGFLGTLEFYPEQGKYHFDGHRKCGIRFSPEESRKAEGICPVCGKTLTLGVASRIHDLSTHPEGRRPSSARPFESLVSLDTVVGQTLGLGPSSIKAKQLIEKLHASLGAELHVLRTAPIEDIEKAADSRLAEAIRRVRHDEIHIESGYDGDYGRVQVFRPGEVEIGRR